MAICVKNDLPNSSFFGLYIFCYFNGYLLRNGSFIDYFGFSCLKNRSLPLVPFTFVTKYSHRIFPHCLTTRNRQKYRLQND